MSSSSLQHDSSVARGVPSFPPKKLATRASRSADKPAAAQPSPARIAAAAKKAPQATQPAPAATVVLPEEEPSRGWRQVLREAPSWLVSAIAHMIALLILGLITLTVQQEPPEMALIANNDAASTEPIEELQLDAEPVEMEQLDVQPAMSDLPDPGAIALGEIAAASETLSTTGIGAMNDSPVGEIGALFGTEGNGMAEAGLGMGGATFFGVKTSGRRFVFVVDNSNSMGQGRFETAVAEIINAVGRLDRKQFFYVVFYSDTAYPLFYPQSSPRMVPATDKNKEMLVNWLSTVQMCLQTRGEEAMQLALSLQPDALYLLGDGAFTDKTIEKTMALDMPRLTIHTLGFGMKPHDAKAFGKLAERFNGTFTDVVVPPAMVQLDQRLQRPRNREQNGPWGIKLGKAKKK